MSDIPLPGLKSELAPGAGLVVRNYSVASQAIPAAARTFITGSQLKVPDSGLQVGSKIRFVLNFTKTAAGTAASTFDISFGTAGTVADTARVSFTKPAGTAAADEGTVIIEAIVRSVGAAGVVVGQFSMTHNLSATGHAVIPAVNVNTVSAGFANNGDPLYVGLNLTSGASDAVTIQQISAELSGV